MRTTIVRALTAVALALVVTVTACSNGDPAGTGGSTTTVAGSGVVFGEGELPDTVPADFPLPPDAVIGQTLVDGANARTEVVVRAAVPIESLAQFYDVNLVTQGYVVDGSSGTSQSWVIDFRRDGLAGTITLIRVEASITQFSLELVGS